MEITSQGVVFLPGIVRIGLGLTSDASTNHPEQRSAQRMDAALRNTASYPLQPVAITNTQHVRDDLNLAEDNKDSFTYKESGLPYAGMED